MKMYVWSYDTIKPGEDGYSGILGWDDWNVRGNLTPELTMSKHEAELLCARLHAWEVGTGHHICAFDVEGVKANEFAVFCGSHPVNS